MITFLDLCSGLGGVSKIAKLRAWNVITVDIDPKFNCDITRDIRDLKINKKFNIVWASPPCIEFSKLSMPWHPHYKLPDTSIVKGCIRIIEETEPEFWIIENVRGSQKYITKILECKPKIYGSRYLWGVFPEFSCDRKKCYGKWKQSPGKNRSAIRSLIPEEITTNLFNSIEEIL